MKVIDIRYSLNYAVMYSSFMEELMKIGYVYITICPNKRVYIGQHQKEKYDKNYYGSGKILKNIIKKYGKNILVNKILEWCDDLNELNKREKWWINYFKKSKLYCINIDEGGKGLEALSRLKLRQSHKNISNTKEHIERFKKYCMNKCPSHIKDDLYYEKTPVRRQDFKRRCINKKLNFEDYIEIHTATKLYGKKLRFYCYYHKSKPCPFKKIDDNDIKLLQQYATEPTPRSTFKTSCKHRNWNFDDFEEIFAGWYYFPNDNKHRARRFFYKKRVED